MSRRDALPRQITSRRRASIRNVTIGAAIVTAALLGIPALVVAGQATTTAEQAVALAQGEPEPLHRAFAEAAAARWLAGGTPVAVAGDGLADMGRPPLDEGLVAELNLDEDLLGQRVGVDVLSVTWESASFLVDADNRVSELHTLLVVTTDGLWRMAVPVVELPATEFAAAQPALGGRPYLDPYPLDAALSDVEPLGWATGMSPTRPGENVTDRVEEWAVAYAADDLRALYDLSGDDRNGVVYRGLGDVDLVDVTVDDAATRPDGALVIRAAITLRTGDAVVFTTDLDMLITNPNQPLPNVAAWGPRGTGADLVASANAVLPDTDFAEMIGTATAELPPAAEANDDSSGEDDVPGFVDPAAPAPQPTPTDEVTSPSAAPTDEPTGDPEIIAPAPETDLDEGNAG